MNKITNKNLNEVAKKVEKMMEHLYFSSNETTMEVAIVWVNDKVEVMEMEKAKLMEDNIHTTIYYNVEDKFPSLKSIKNRILC